VPPRPPASRHLCLARARVVTCRLDPAGVGASVSRPVAAHESDEECGSTCGLWQTFCPLRVEKINGRRRPWTGERRSLLCAVRETARALARWLTQPEALNWRRIHGRLPRRNAVAAASCSPIDCPSSRRLRNTVFLISWSTSFSMSWYGEETKATAWSAAASKRVFGPFAGQACRYRRNGTSLWSCHPWTGHQDMAKPYSLRKSGRNVQWSDLRALAAVFDDEAGPWRPHNWRRALAAIPISERKWSLAAGPLHLSVAPAWTLRVSDLRLLDADITIHQSAGVGRTDETRNTSTLLGSPR